MNNSGGTSGGGGTPTGSGGAGTMSRGGGGERAGGGSPTFSSRGLNSFKPGIEGPKSSPMINLKNATEANSKFARSESLAFKAEGAKPMINLNNPKVEFKNPAFKHEAEREGSNLRNLEGWKLKHKTTVDKPSPPIRQKPVFERKFNPETTTHREAFKKIIQARYEHHGYKFEPSVAIARKAEIKQAAMQALKANSEPTTKTAPRSAENARTGASSRYAAESSIKTQIERAVKTAMAKITRVETETQPQYLGAKLFHSEGGTGRHLGISTETQTQPTIRMQEQTQTQVAQEVKTEISKKSETQTINDGVEITDDKEKVKESEKDPKEPKKRFAYFEVDTKTNAKRIQEAIKAFTKAKIATLLRGQTIIRRKDVAANLDGVKMKKTESKSIEGIEDDGSAKLFTEYIAKEGVVASMEDIRQVAANAANAATATNLTEKPNNQVVGKKEALLVHNGQTVFLANLDNKPARVKLDENLVEAA